MAIKGSAVSTSTGPTTAGSPYSFQDGHRPLSGDEMRQRGGRHELGAKRQRDYTARLPAVRHLVLRLAQRIESADAKSAIPDRVEQPR